MTAAAPPPAKADAGAPPEKVHPQMLLRDAEPQPTGGRYRKALAAVPDRFFRPSTRSALKRLAQTAAFCYIAIHALSIAPAWALPVCWVFAGFAFIFVFEVGHDCVNNNFFGSKAVNDLLGCLSLAPLVQPAVFWSRQAEEVRANRELFPVSETQLGWGDADDAGAAADADADGAAKPAAQPSALRRRGKKHRKGKAAAARGAAAADADATEADATEADDIGQKSRRMRDWGSQACNWTTRGWHVSHLAVAAFVFGVLPWVGVRHGVWAVVKFWLVPFGLFHLYMGQFVKQGTRLTVDLGEMLPRGWLVDWQLRSYLRFHLAVPSYRLPEAADRVKRMWERQALDGADGPPEPIERIEDVRRLHDSFALGSFVRGWSQLRLFDSALSAMLRIGVALWLYLLWSQRAPDGVGRLLAHPHVEAARRWVAEFAASRMHMVAATALVGAIFAVRRYARQPSVYLVDFTTYTAPKELEVPVEVFRKMQRDTGAFDEESIAFMDRLIERTGLGQKTYLPPGCHQVPPDISFLRAREEAEMVMFGVLDQLFATTGTRPSDIDVLIVNCSLFNPTPSLCGMIINKYKMREDIESYNLSGMGCSAHVIAVHLAKDLVRAKPGSRAVVVSTENITMNWYWGRERSMLVSNTLFRVGGGACLFSSRPADAARSKYRLLHTVRTHRGADNAAYGAVFQEEDKAGVLGVRLSKDLMRVAGEALKHNITTLGPLVLPLHEQLRYLVSMFRRKVLRHKVKAYVPRFKSAIDHFCVHAGGRAVIDAIQEALALEDEDVAASRATLHRYGNVSSSSVLYELAYLERHGKITRGNKVWLVAFGSGFSANSAIYEAL